MSYSPCLLIPIYNHGESIGATVARLLAYELPILIVDDGSDAATQRVLERLAAAYPQIRLSHRAQNGGKGAAVMDGMRQALAAGYSHALQIDADGQHDTADVARFLELGAAHPQALVCGQPVYDASVPKGRLYGRYVTHFWVAVETLGQARIDTMCGFRLYPLIACCALIKRVRLPTRMDFDIEIMVRLAWAGVDFVTLPTRVTYPADGLSHFDLWRDNLRISLMHTRLTCGMLLRAPMLLLRRLRPGNSERAHWSRVAERGSLLGIRIVAACYRLFGERAARRLLKPITGYFLLTGSAARAASLAYLRRVHARLGKAPPTWRDSFDHMLAFASSGLDKLAAWLGGIDSRRVDFAGRDELLRLMATGRGAVLVGAHLGNLEMTRALAVNERRATVNAVVYSAHAQRLEHYCLQAPEQWFNFYDFWQPVGGCDGAREVAKKGN